jgi:hypothetical protein
VLQYGHLVAGKRALGDAEQQEIHKSKLWRFFDSYTWVIYSFQRQDDTNVLERWLPLLHRTREVPSSKVDPKSRYPVALYVVSFSFSGKFLSNNLNQATASSCHVLSSFSIDHSTYSMTLREVFERRSLTEHTMNKTEV